MDLTDRTASYILLLIILGFALVWEGVIEALQSFCPSQLRPTVNRVVVELAELGLVSLLVYIPSDSAWFLNLSNSFFGDCHHLLSLIHDTHFLVFYGMSSFLVFVICITLSGSWWLWQWHSFETSAREPTEEAEFQRHFARPRFLWYQYIFFAGSSRIDYRLIRRQFLREVNADELRHSWEVEQLPANFEFNTYLKLQQGTFYETLVNIMGISWITLFIIIGICYFTLHLELWLHTTLVVAAQAILFFISLSVHIYCVWLYQRLFPWTISDTVPTIKPSRSQSMSQSLSLGRLLKATVSGSPEASSKTGYTREASVETSHDHPGNRREVSVENDHDHVAKRAVSFEDDHEHTAQSSWHMETMAAVDAELSPSRVPEHLSSAPPSFPAHHTLHVRTDTTPMPTLQSVHDSTELSRPPSSTAVDCHAIASPPPYGRQRWQSPRSPPPDLPEGAAIQVDEDKEEKEQSRRAEIPRNHVVYFRFVIQVIILLSGLNNAFFIDLAAPYLVQACKLSGSGLSYTVFALHIVMLLGEISSILQTIRINTFLCSTGTNKNYSSISWVLHQMKLRGMLQHLKEQQLGDKKYSSNKALANDLFDRLDMNKNGVVTAKEIHMCLTEISRDCTLSAHDVLGVMRHMDSDGDGYISRKDFLKECRYILER